MFEKPDAECRNSIAVHCYAYMHELHSCAISAGDKTRIKKAERLLKQIIKLGIPGTCDSKTCKYKNESPECLKKYRKHIKNEYPDYF